MRPRRPRARHARRVCLALALAASASLASEPVPVPPGGVVRWPGADLDECALEDRRWAPLSGACFFPVDLLREPSELVLSRTRLGRRESRRVLVADYPYPVQRIELPDDRMVNLSPEDLARALAAPLAPLPSGGRFGARRFINGEPRSPHSGADYPAPRGTPVRAVAGGRVVLAEEHFFGGRSVFVHHGDGLVSMYLHLDRILVGEGDPVDRSQPVGAVGSTGRATGPHLHFGLRWHGARVDPELLLAPGEALPSLTP